MSIIERNAIVTSFNFTQERGFSCWLGLKLDGFEQSFGGYMLYSEMRWRTDPNYCGRFIKRVSDICGVEDLMKVKGATIRVRYKRDGGLGDTIASIGHIVKDDWYDPQEDLKS